MLPSVLDAAEEDIVGEKEVTGGRVSREANCCPESDVTGALYAGGPLFDAEEDGFLLLELEAADTGLVNTLPSKPAR